MNDTIKPSTGDFATPQSRPPSIFELFGLAEVTCEDVSNACIALVLQPIGVTEIRGIMDIALRNEILYDITTRANSHQTPKFYLSTEHTAGGAIYCNLSGNVFQVVGYKVLNRGSSFSPVPPGFMHMILTPSICDYMVISNRGTQLREMLGALPVEFRCPVEVQLTSSNLFRLMFIPSHDAYSDDGPFDLYFRLQWRLLNNYLQAFYGTEIGQPSAQHYEGAYLYMRFGAGCKVFNDIMHCREVRLMYEHPRALIQASTVMSGMIFVQYCLDVVDAVGHSEEIELWDGTELPVMSALYALSHSNVQCVKDLTGLDKQREIVARLLCDADLRTAVVAGALKAIATMRASDTYDGRMDYNVLATRFLPCLARRITGLPESIYRLVRTYLACDPAPNVGVSRGIITQLCSIPGFQRAAAISESSGVDTRSILLNGITRNVIARDSVAGYAMMAEALVQSKMGGKDVETLCRALEERWSTRHSSAVSPEETLSYLRRSISRLDKSGLQELVAAMVADQIATLLPEGGQCSAELLTNPRIEEVRDEAITKTCVKVGEYGLLSDFFLSLMQNRPRTFYASTQLGCRLRLPDNDSSPSVSVSDIDAAERDSEIGR